jgi:F0F1-type ATP synthase delta subunit
MARRNTAPRRYAEAAFEVATRDSTLDRWRADLDIAASIAGDQRSLDVLANPAIPIERRATALDQLLVDQVSGQAANLVRLLLRRGRIELDLKVDPDLLGGLVVRVGDRMIDGSVRSRLERLRNQLVSGAL